MTYLEVTMSHLNFGAAKNAKSIILTPKSPAANAIETNTVVMSRRRRKTKRNIKNGTGDVIVANIPINTVRISNVMGVKNSHI